MTDLRTSVQKLIDIWPSLSDFASDAGVEYGTAKQMRRRSSIGLSYWPRIIAGAAERKIEGVSYESLGKAHVEKAESGAAA